MITIDENLGRQETISRYVSLAKFLDLIKRKRLYFASLSLFEDQHEGSSTNLNTYVETGLLDAINALANYSFSDTFAINLSADERARFRREGEAIRNKKRVLQTPFGDFDITEPGRYQEVMRAQRNWIDVSSWHRNDDESLAMWKTYGSGTESVCIISSVGALANSLAPSDNLTVEIHSVHYIDHITDHFRTGHRLDAAIHKQKPYSYENEIRALAVCSSSDILSPRNERGCYIEAEPATLITALRLSPQAPKWFRELVEIETQALQIPIYQSALDEFPIFGQ
jgi:hypothetical protein